jgi:zinc transporter 1/2/3
MATNSSANPDQLQPTPPDVENNLVSDIKSASISDYEVTPEYDTTTTDGIAQLIAIAIMEFGVISHSVFIGLTLAVNEQFTTLFIVIVFHRMLTLVESE